MRVDPNKDLKSVRACVIWSDIGPYHAARSKVVNLAFPAGVDTIEILDRPGFKEFRSGSLTADSSFPRHSLALKPPIKVFPARRLLHAKLDQLRPDVVFTPGWGMIESLLAI
jgi:hypothetical protein